MSALASTLVGGALGALTGVAYFAALGWNVRLYARPHPGWAAGAAHLARFALAALCFAAIARDGGAVALLASFAAFLVVRRVAIRRVQRHVEAGA